ncbi:MAG: hypothetical protein HY815_33290, partial [Candidatus Riflebacteria bacterium]|nr:hypothetical protein [Candidatus Riflebacteria bacterium]
MRAIQGVGSAVGTRLKALLRAEGAPVAMLGAAVLMFVNRLHGAGGPLEGDAFQNLYFWIHPELALAGYDPSRTDYFASNTLHGLFSPLHWLFFGLLSLLPAVPPLVRAYLLNVLVAASLIMLLGLGVYAFVRARGLSRSAALLAASIASFTGFHLVGVREFDYFYLYSFAAVAPLFHCVLRMGEAGRDRTAWTVAAGLIVGVSLLGGGNVPLFLYVPFLFLVPVLARPWRRPDRALAAWLGSIAGSVTLGLMIAAPVLVVGLGNRRLWNRAGLGFQEFGSFDPVSLVCTLLLRDWWSLGVVHFHERDAFLGLPVIALALHGAVVTVRACADHRTRSIPSGPAAEPGLRLVLALCAVWGLLVMLCGVLPDAMQRAIGTFYTAQSIRYPHRFAMLVQLPVAYLAAVGLDAASGRGFVRMLFWGLTGTGLVAWAALVGPVDTLVRALPD